MTLIPSFSERLLHRLHLLPTPVMDVFAGVLFGRVLAAGVRLNLFELLVTSPLSSRDVAHRAGLHPRAVELLLEAYVAGGYVRRKNGRYFLDKEAKKWLLRDSPNSLVHLIAYVETLYGRWNQIDEALRNGRPRIPYYETFSESDWMTYVLGMRDLARLLIPHVIGTLTSHVGARRLLDIGSSHGLYAMECCRRIPLLRASLVDFDPALRVARSTVKAEGFSERVEFLPGDLRDMNLPGQQDIVLLCNVIHGLTGKENAELIRRIRLVLRPGGRVYILDQLEGDARNSTLSRIIPLMVGLNLLNEVGGNAYTQREVKEWCRGFSSVRSIRLRLPGVMLVEARLS